MDIMISASTKAEGKARDILEKYKRELARKVERSCKAVADFILRKSKELVPVDTTTLWEDGKVRQEDGGLESVFVVAYGTIGKSVGPVWSDREQRMVIRSPQEYAVYVHETKVGPNRTMTGTWEFLAIPLRNLDGNREVFNVVFAGASIG